ncbi:MAG: DUF2971 domain-containing protein [Alphaproteobacteria bacterium]|nr:MAG: DUF2971 domain-containing protein [Alphaproteobacteria bacterium]
MMDLIPEKFYKYRSLDGEALKRVERTVLHDELYFGTAESFNDPFDLRAVFDFEADPAIQRADFIRRSHDFEPHLSERERNAAADRVMANALDPANIATTTMMFQFMHNRMIRSSVGIYCVSTVPDDILMWSHYASDHRGICLEFDGLGALMAQAQRVRYVLERPSINPYAGEPERRMECALLTKAKPWEYEAEWRIVSEDGPGPVRFGPAELTGIIIGAAAPQATVDTVRKWCAQRSLPLRIMRAQVDARSFKLNLLADARQRPAGAIPTGPDADDNRPGGGGDLCIRK